MSRVFWEMLEKFGMFFVSIYLVGSIVYLKLINCNYKHKRIYKYIKISKHKSNIYIYW